MFKSVFKSGLRALYTVLDNPLFVLEPWYVYPAKHKQTGKLALVFIFDKTKFELLVSRMSGQKLPRMVISECYEIIRHLVGQLSKLRHPQVLTVLEPLEDTKTKFLFATEMVTENLVTTNLDKLDELTIQQGVLQIAKCVQFLHNHGNIIHFNLQPLLIFINSDGDWKVAGFDFLKNLAEISPLERSNFRVMDNLSIVPFANLNLNFTAPELLLDNENTQLDFGNDIWSIGCLLFYLFNKGDFLIGCFDPNSINDYRSEFRKFEQKFYNHRPDDLSYVLKDVPKALYPVFPHIMARYPHDRITIDQFIDCDYFNGSIIKAMWFIDEFSTKNMDEKLFFMKTLLEQDLMAQFPNKFKQTKLLHLMMDSLISELSILPAGPINPEIDQLISYFLQAVLTVGLTLSLLTFQDRIYIVLLKDNGSKKKDSTFQRLVKASVKTRLTLVRNYDVLLAKLNDREFCDLVKQLINLVLTALPEEIASNTQEQIQLQELFLTRVPDFIDKFDFPYIKNTLVPMLCTVFKTTTILLTKLATVTTFEALVNQRVIDKIIVTEQLLPIFKNLKSRDKRIVAAVLQFFSKLCASDHISLDVENSVESVLPQCMLLAFGCSDCTKQEFTQFMSSITTIQNKLVERKMLSLSDGPKTANFDTFISGQQINSRKDSMETNPKSQPLQAKPRVALGSSSSLLGSLAPSSRPGLAGSSSAPLVPAMQPSSHRHLKPLQPKQPQGTTLKPNQPNRTALTPARTPLSFGATLSAPSASTNRLLSTLNGTTFTKDEDDFDDFQQASAASPAPSLGINWDIEAKKRIDVPIYGANLMNSYRPQLQSVSSTPAMQPMLPSLSLPLMQPMSPRPMALTPAMQPMSPKYPPGFTSTLTPTHTGNSQPQQPATQPSKPSEDLLDFL